MRFHPWLPLLLALCCVQPAAAATARSAKLEPVVLQLKWLHQFQFAGYYAAVEQGYYREAGLEVELREAGPGLDLGGELVAGRAQYLVSNPSALLDRAAGKPLVALAAIFQHSPLVIVSRKAQGIRAPSDLIGRRTMFIPEMESELAAMCLNEGVALDRIDILPHSWNVADLISGRTEAMSAYLTDVPFFLRQQGIPFHLLRPLNYGIDFYGDVLFTTRGEIRRHPARVKAFREASLRGWAYAMRHPAEIVEVIRTRYGSRLPRAQLLFEAAAMQPLILPRLVEVGHMNSGRWQHIVDTYIALGMLPADYSLEGFLYQPEASHFWTVQKLRWLLAALILGGASVLLLLVFNRRLRSAVRKRTRELSAANLELKAESAQHQRAIQALNDSEQRFRALVDNLPGAVYQCALDSDWTVYFISDEVETITGYPASDFLRNRVRSFGGIIVPEDRERVEQTVLEGVQTRRPYAIDYRIRHADGSIRWIYEKGQAAYTVTGDPLHLDGVIMDNTDRKRAEQALLEFDRMKNEFISTAAHELRTPLTSVLGYAELLLDAYASASNNKEQQREFLQVIHNKGEVLAELVDNLLDISRIESGQPLSLHKRPCEINVLVEQVVRHNRMSAASHVFEVALEPVASQALWVDHNRIVQVLENLISNAVKYSPPGSLVRIEGQAGEETYGIAVCDEGMGMSPDQKEKIFDKFYRANAANTAVGGLGMGMSIVRQIVLAHGGTIEVQSAPQQGTRVTIVLPLLHSTEAKGNDRKSQVRD